MPNENCNVVWTAMPGRLNTSFGGLPPRGRCPLPVCRDPETGCDSQNGEHTAKSRGFGCIATAWGAHSGHPPPDGRGSGTYLTSFWLAPRLLAGVATG